MIFLEVNNGIYPKYNTEIHLYHNAFDLPPDIRYNQIKAHCIYYQNYYPMTECMV